MEVCELLGKKPGKFLKDIMNDIEYKLINKLLINDKNALKQYVLDNYK